VARTGHVDVRCVRRAHVASPGIARAGGSWGLPRILQGIRRNVCVTGHHGPTATKGTVMKRLIVGLSMTALLWGGVAGVVGAAAAQAEPKAPVPLGSWPGCPEDNPSGPCRWCPGDPPVQTGNLRTNPVVWDTNVCHTYWYVYFGQGNVAQNIFEGDAPPPPPPPPPPALISTREQCEQILGIFCPNA
jgi:hypothetical protein